jgi:hypothetical protein
MKIHRERGEDVSTEPGATGATPSIVGTAEVLDGLNDLLQLDHDAIGAYEIAIERLLDRDHALQIESFRQDHARHIAKLNEVIAGLGGTPLNEPHPTAPLKEAIQRLAAAGGDRALLLAWRSNERQVSTKYDVYARKARRWPPEVKRVVDENALDEERHYAWVVGALEVDAALPEAGEGLREGLARARETTADAQRRLGRMTSGARFHAVAGLEIVAERLSRLSAGRSELEGVSAHAADGAQAIARGMEAAASFLRTDDGLARVRERLEGEVRTNPARSLAATFAIGFVAGRIIR